MLIGLILSQQKKMEDSGRLILENLIKLTKSSENQFKRGNFKGALEDKMKANAILKSESCDEKIIQKYRKELSILYSTSFLHKIFKNLSKTSNSFLSTFFSL